MEITPKSVIIFVAGIVAGIVVSYVVGKYLFEKFIKKQGDLVTLENTARFSLIQQGLNYVLGFAIGSVALALTFVLPVFLGWLAVQTWLAVKIFGFSHPKYGLTFVSIDTVTDLAVGAAFGQGAATFTLVRMMLMGT